MRRFVVLSLIAFVVSSCASPQPMLFKPGTSFNRKQTDLDRCRIASFKAVPQALMTEVTPGYYDPGFIDCYRGHHGHRMCVRRGGYYTPPSSYTYDRNDGLRNRYVISCLNRKGYNVLTLPRCKTAEDRTAALNEKNASLLKCNPDPTFEK